MREVQPLDLAWMAGVIDSDGCICISKSQRLKNHAQNYQLTVTVVGCIFEIVKRFQDAFPALIEVDPAGRYGRKRTIYRWKIQAKKAEGFLNMIRPYLVGKTEQADVALTFRGTFRRDGKRHCKQTSAEIDFATRRAMYDSLKALHNGETTKVGA